MLGDLKRNIYKYLLNRGLLRTKIVVLMYGAQNETYIED